MRILLIDNNDSFTYNLYHQIVRVVRSDASIISYSCLNKNHIVKYDCFIISAGPGTPDEYDRYDVVLESGKPVFGVCLGMQIINRYYGGEVSELKDARHGVTANLEMNGEVLDVAVYNSLYCSKVSDQLNVFLSSEKVPMGLIHRSKPIAGIQFHPESFMTKRGDDILQDVLGRIGII